MNNPKKKHEKSPKNPIKPSFSYGFPMENHHFPRFFPWKTMESHHFPMENPWKVAAHRVTTGNKPNVGAAGRELAPEGMSGGCKMSFLYRICMNVCMYILYMIMYVYIYICIYIYIAYRIYIYIYMNVHVYKIE